MFPLKSTANPQGDMMKTSATNIPAAIVVELFTVAVTSHVGIYIGCSLVTPPITKDAVKDLGLIAGRRAYAVITASDLLVGAGE